MPDKKKIPSKLADEAAEGEAQLPAPSSTSQKKNTGKAKPMNRGNLGTLDVGAYLNHYGREHFVKPQGELTLYCLKECVFDHSHGPNDASIVQSSSQPYLTYQCFHDTCKAAGRTWKDARVVISGDDSLAPFCSGYDPEWKPPAVENVSTGLIESVGEYNMSPALTALFSDKLPPPDEINPAEFFIRIKSKRKFLASLMAKYIVGLIGDLVHTHGVFWAYTPKGIWQEISEDQIASIIVHALGDYLTPSWIVTSISTLKGLVERHVDDWGSNPELICCKNGMVNVDAEDRKNALISHDAKYGAKAQIPCIFGVKYFKKLDRWLKFLDEVFPGRNEKGKIDVLQQFFGYCLLTDCRYAKALWLIGGGANGKSVVIDVLTGMLGEENVSALSMHELGERFRTYAMENKFANLAAETTREAMGTSTFKKLVSGDLVSAERKYGDAYMFRNFAKNIFSLNEPPVVLDKSHGFARRLIVIEFLRQFAEDEQDHTLAKKIIENELDGVFMWALDGLMKLLENDGFEELEEVNKAKKRLILAMYPFQQFIQECCDLGEDEQVAPKEMWKSYQDWCKEGQYSIMSRNRFYNQIMRSFPAVGRVRTTNGKRIFKGINLKVYPDE